MAIAILLSNASRAELYINEIYWDPPANPDTPREYIELRGTPGMSLDSHYLLFIENEDNATRTGRAGVIDMMFNLHGRTIGSNGFLSLRQKTSPFAVALGANNLINIGFGAGWGSGGGSSIGALDEGNEGEIENSGFTAILVNTNGLNLPTIGFDIDIGNDGLDHPSGRIGWTILDSIGVFGESGEAGFGRTYAKINFGPEFAGQMLLPNNGGVLNPETGDFEFVPNIESGATYVGTGYEIELVARWGNSTGYSASDWHVSNVTDEAGSGSQNWTDLRQSCVGNQCHPADDGDDNTPPPLGLAPESNHGVPYGTQLLNTLGQPNFMLGDFNKDGYVDAADYTVWRNSVGQIGTELADHPADPNHDYAVDAADYAVWKANYGAPFADPGGSGAFPNPSRLISYSIAAPEPTSAALFVIGIVLPIWSAYRPRRKT